MNAREEGLLLLSSSLGDGERRPLSAAQLRTLAARVAAMARPTADREMTREDLMALGYGREMAERILNLLGEQQRLHRYLAGGQKAGCVALTRISQGYPQILHSRLGLEAPGVLWAKGDLTILQRPRIALVGSRDIAKPNADFAAQVGREAARQGYVLVSGNARGADRIAQKACLHAGGQIISVVADELTKQECRANALYLSEDGFERPFSSPRALSRNRVIHALGEKVLVAQCTLGSGGTWSGSVHNLKTGCSPLFCFRDGSEAMMQLAQLGANLVETADLADFKKMQIQSLNFLSGT